MGDRWQMTIIHPWLSRCHTENRHHLHARARVKQLCSPAGLPMKNGKLNLIFSSRQSINIIVGAGPRNQHRHNLSTQKQHRTFPQRKRFNPVLLKGTTKIIGFHVGTIFMWAEIGVKFPNLLANTKSMWIKRFLIILNIGNWIYIILTCKASFSH